MVSGCWHCPDMTFGYRSTRELGGDKPDFIESTPIDIPIRASVSPTGAACAAAMALAPSIPCEASPEMPSHPASHVLTAIALGAALVGCASAASSSNTPAKPSKPGTGVIKILALNDLHGQI